MPIQSTDMRSDTYSVGSFDFIAETKSWDYNQGDYDFFRKVLAGDATVGFQLGALIAQTIIYYKTAFEIGLLPTVIVSDLAGKYDEENSVFANEFLSEQHPYLLEMCETKNALGDAFLAFNLDRKLETIDPDVADPGFLPYSNALATVRVIQNKYVRDMDTGRKIKLKITRNYSDEEIEYVAELQTKAKFTNVKVPDKLKLPNPLGVCPVQLIPNLKKSGYAFGWSDLHHVIPYLEMFHRVLGRGAESQQYSGKPILVVTGIQGDVASWFLRTFGIDITKTGSTNDSVIMDFFKKHKMLALADEVKAEFIESKSPIGKTEEILKQVIHQISRVTGIPQFLFGAEVSGSEAAVREQYSGLLAINKIKQAQLTHYLITLIRWAMVWYSSYVKNEETGTPFEKIGTVNKLEDTNKFRIKLVWPELIGSDGRLKIEAITALGNAGAMSRLSMAKNFPQYISNPTNELEIIKKEMTEFQPSMDTVPQTDSTKASKERVRSNPSNSNNAQDAPYARAGQK